MIRYCAYNLQLQGHHLGVASAADIDAIVAVRIGNNGSVAHGKKIAAAAAVSPTHKTTEVEWRGRVFPVKNDELAVALLEVHEHETAMAKASAIPLEARLALFDKLFHAYAEAEHVAERAVKANRDASARIATQRAEETTTVLAGLLAYVKYGRMTQNMVRGLLLMESVVGHGMFLPACGKRFADGKKPLDAARIAEDLQQVKRGQRIPSLSSFMMRLLAC